MAMHRNNMMAMRRKGKLSLLALAAPAALLYSIFFIWPLVNGLWLSFTDWNGLTKRYHFVGVRNFVELLGDRAFLSSIDVTLRYALFVVYLQVTLALGLADCDPQILDARQLRRGNTVFQLSPVIFVQSAHHCGKCGLHYIPWSRRRLCDCTARLETWPGHADVFRAIHSFNRDWNYIMAMFVLSVTPVVIFYLFAQRKIIEGMVAGALKQ